MNREDERLSVQVIAASESLTPGQCSELGFASNNLMCSSCNDLKQFKLNELESSCRQCCADDDGDQEEAKTVGGGGGQCTTTTSSRL